MQNAECRMQNWGICLADDLKSCQRHTFILHFAFWISHFPDAGKVKKNPIPWQNRGGIQSIPRFHPGYGQRPSLIDAVTGAPGRAFLPCGSEVVSIQAGIQMPFTMRHPLWESYRECVSSSQLLLIKIYHNFLKMSMLKSEKCFWGPNLVNIIHCWQFRYVSYIILPIM